MKNITTRSIWRLVFNLQAIIQRKLFFNFIIEVGGIGVMSGNHPVNILFEPKFIIEPIFAKKKLYPVHLFGQNPRWRPELGQKSVFNVFLLLVRFLQIPVVDLF